MEFTKKFPHKFRHGVNNENVSGDYLTNCKNTYDCFDCREQWDCKYIQQGWDDAKNCLDCTDIGLGAELLYECTNIGDRVYNDCFCTHCFPTIADSNYCYFTNFAKNLFGCVGLKHGQYCILNKQYTKEEYFKLREKIIEHMSTERRSASGGKIPPEWGEFFPSKISPLGYNQTFAQEYFPLTKEEALAKGYKWKDKISRDFKPTTIENIPDDITDVEDSICKEILACENCSKNYQIQKPELRFYRKMNLPIPRKCPDCRHADRMKLRNPRTLFTRNCGDCQAEIQTTFAPDRPEKVLCEACYLKVVN